MCGVEDGTLWVILFLEFAVCRWLGTPGPLFVYVCVYGSGGVSCLLVWVV